MMHKAWSSIEEVPYCFSRSYIKFQCHTALKIIEFYPNWAFPDSNSSLNSPMAMKCCTKLETAKERCPIVFQGHPSNFKVTRDKTSPILTQIGRFRIIGRSQLSNPSDLPCSFNFLCITRPRYVQVLFANSTRFQMVWLLAATKQLYEWYFLSVCLSVCPSVRLSHLFDYVPIIVSSWNFQELSHWTRVRSMQKVKVRGQRSRSQRSRPKFSFPDCNSSLNSHMMIKWYI